MHSVFSESTDTPPWFTKVLHFQLGIVHTFSLTELTTLEGEPEEVVHAS